MDSRLIISRKKAKDSCGSKIELFCPAKVNLYLNITGKYPGGYHRLESIAERVSLCDRLSIETKPGPGINISSSLKQLESKENLVYTAVRLMSRKLKVNCGFNIDLKKNIPVGAGLGGGSSDAASAILGINELFDSRLAQEELYQIGKKIGSDLNFFLSGSRFACLSGRGEQVEPFPAAGKLKHFIIWPGVSAATDKVYGNSKAKLTRFFSSVNILKYALKKKDYRLLREGVYNCLEKSVFSLYKKLSEVKRTLDKKNIFSLMSGSGGAFYTIGARSYKEVKSNLPDDWVIYKVQTF